MIKYIKGDVLKATQSMIVHQVNCQGVMGSGVAKAIKKRYPIVAEAYNWLYDNYTYDSDEVNPEARLMGNAQLVEISDGRIICNLFSQLHYLPRTIRHTSYDAMEIGFQDIKKCHKGDIAMPRIGCGLGGGDWKIVSAIIESVFDDRDVYIYDLE